MNVGLGASQGFDGLTSDGPVPQPPESYDNSSTNNTHRHMSP
ncbi:hypothetical protein [Bifidobacterium crudilactis]|nr:hypothetical protein [Bifidobacterium crudilactis]